MSWFSDFVESVKEAFSGPSDSDRSPSTSPQQRPSIMTVGGQRVATRDRPRAGISAGDTASEPEYSAFSLRGLTSSDPANVMRNIQAAERLAAAAPTGGDSEDRPAPAPAAAAPAPAPAAAAATPAPALTSVADQEAQIERAGETAAARARRLGLASTIATSPGGLLAGGEGTTRRRRSLMGGGLIA
jgi:hypothetical protein